MSAVLVVDDDQSLRGSLVRELRGAGHEVQASASVSEALSQLDVRSFDVVLTDLRMAGRDGIDLLRSMKKSSPRTQPILMSAFATARDHQVATELGATRVLCKPFTPGDLFEAINHAVESRHGFRGQVHGLSLVDILQMFHFGRRSLTIVLDPHVPALVHLAGGEVIHAQYAERKGPEALRLILALDSGNITTTTLKAEERSITEPFDMLLLDALRQLDEQEPDDLDLDAAFGEFSLEASGPVELSAGSIAATREVVEALVRALDGALWAGVVDLDQGRCVAAAADARLDCDLEEAVLGSIRPILGEGGMGQLEAAIAAAEGSERVGRIREVLLMGAEHMHFHRVFPGGRFAAVLVATQGTGVGMGWATLRSIAHDLQRVLGA